MATQWCEEAKYVEERLDIANCLECLKTKDKCFHDSPRFNTGLIRNLLEAERKERLIPHVLEVMGARIIFNDWNYRA